MGAPRRSSPIAVLGLVLGVGVLVALGVWLNAPLAVPAVYLGMSVLSCVVYAVDKSAAGTPRRRVPERTLLVLGFLGGWPGAVIAQQALRHKTRKRSFQLRFWATVVGNLVVLAALLSTLNT
jgi:uncharacterized membrane protein YsdA (DUF1294 family)